MGDANQLTACVFNDQTFAREGIERYLSERKGIKVIGSAASKEDALAMLSQFHPDVLLTEILLRSDLCLDVIQAVREANSKTKILVVSRQSERVFAERSLRCGAQGFVSLMAPMEDVDQALSTVMAGDVYLSRNSRSQVLGRLIGKEDAIKRDRFETLTRREMEVFVRTGRGCPPREIAAELDLSVKTIETYREKIKDKLGLRNSHEVLKYAMECALFDFHIVGVRAS